MSLLLLIPVVWLALVCAILAICKMASKSDTQEVETVAPQGEQIVPGLIVWDTAVVPAVARTRVQGERTRRFGREPSTVA
jgi:hypothetical protein